MTGALPTDPDFRPIAWQEPLSFTFRLRQMVEVDSKQPFPLRSTEVGIFLFLLLP
jgi:hypothetical protein